MLARALFLLALLAAPVHAAQPVIPGLSARPDLDPAMAGSLLLGELNCTSCHAPGGHAPWIAKKAAPSLVTAGLRIRPGYLERYIADPHAAKPGTTMPAMLGHLGEADRLAAAKALTHYLVRNSPVPAAPPAEAGSVERGKELYHAVGCVACHDPEGMALPDSMPLGPVAEKYHFADLVKYLENPLATRPGGRMPDLGLGHWEATDVAAYLLRDQGKEPGPGFVIDDSLADRGAVLFGSLGCVSCHQEREPASIPLEKVDPSRGCLSGEPGKWPHYALRPAQRGAIVTALATNRPPPGTNQQIELILTRHNCIACHQRDEYGGIPDERRPYFTTSNENLGEQASIPPALTLAGHKFHPEWLRKILSQGHAVSVRPYMNTRMPRFGIENLGDLPQLLAAADTLPAIDFRRVADGKQARTTGAELVGAKGLGCVACHTWDGKTASTLAGLDLTVMTARVREQWFHHYLRDPQRFSPQTIMPSYWPAGKPVRPEILEGDSGLQIDAIWQYLSQGRQGRPPAGLVREPIPVVVGAEAVMLRRSYPGIGKRGIGVGYPKGISLSFDAGQMRLGSIWRGGFIEASGVWRGQGSGNASEMGTDISRFPEGPALALLPAPGVRWPVDDAKQAPGFRFLGYTLDELRRPTFRYLFANAAFEDRFTDELDERGQAFFRRTLTWTHEEAPDGLHLRLALDPEIAAAGDNAYAVGKSLVIETSAPAEVRDLPGGKELLVPLTGLNAITINYHWPPAP